MRPSEKITNNLQCVNISSISHHAIIYVFLPLVVNVTDYVHNPEYSFNVCLYLIKAFKLL